MKKKEKKCQNASAVILTHFFRCYDFFITLGVSFALNRHKSVALSESAVSAETVCSFALCIEDTLSNKRISATS